MTRPCKVCGRGLLIFERWVLVAWHPPLPRQKFSEAPLCERCLDWARRLFGA